MPLLWGSGRTGTDTPVLASVPVRSREQALAAKRAAFTELAVAYEADAQGSWTTTVAEARSVMRRVRSKPGMAPAKINRTSAVKASWTL